MGQQEGQREQDPLWYLYTSGVPRVLGVCYRDLDFPAHFFREQFRPPLVFTPICRPLDKSYLLAPLRSMPPAPGPGHDTASRELVAGD